MAIERAAEATGTEFSAGIPVELQLEEDEGRLPAGTGPYKLAWRRLRRNRGALFFGVVFLVIVVLCLLAPVYANDIAHTGPNENHITEQIRIGGKLTYVVNTIGLPIGPTWQSKFFLGADPNGRDEAVRLLYGGRNSLEVGAVAMVITMILSIIVGILAGYTRGWVDAILSRVLDIIWAYPVYILGVALGVSLALGGIGPLHGNSLVVPAFVIGFVYIPYVAKPVRGQVLGIREREFVDAARVQGLSHARIMATEILPNLASTIIVFVPLILANAILLEAGLSFLGAGVQPPNPSWGTMIADGVANIPAAIHLVLVPGLMLVIAVLSINVFGDGVRDALDPRAKIRVSH
jgi:peptide/nickel transport system permease protein